MHLQPERPKYSYFLLFNITTNSKSLGPEDERDTTVIMKKGLGHNCNIGSKTVCIIGNVGESRTADQQEAFAGCSLFLVDGSEVLTDPTRESLLS